MSDRKIAIFAYGLACGLLMSAIELFVHPGLDRQLMAMALAGCAALAGLIGTMHARRRAGR